VYCAAYVIHDGDSVAVLAPAVMPPRQVSLQGIPDGDAWIGCGDGFLSYPDLLDKRLTEVRPDCWPTAAAVARLAAPRLARGESAGAGTAAPLYVRDKVALTTIERLARGGLK